MKLIETARLCTGFLFSLILSACSHTQSHHAQLSASHLSVPFIKQEDAYCGPSSVAMVLAMHQQQIDVEKLASEMLLPAKSGSLQVEVKSTVRRNGFLAYELDPDFSALSHALKSGYPVIALVNLSFDWLPKWHYVVVTGIDPEREEVILHSGDTADQRWTFTQFQNLWARGKNWSVVVISPQEAPPEFVEKSRYLKSVLDLQHSATNEIAKTAFKRALMRWPDDLTALVALGNIAYEERNYEASAGWLRQAVISHPDSVVAKNNLAQVLLEMNKTKEAFEYAKQAVRAGGGPRAQETLDQVLQRLIAK